MEVGTVADAEASAKKYNGITIVFCYSKTCPSCAYIQPHFQGLVQEFGNSINFLRISIDDSDEITKAFDVKFLPHFVAMDNSARKVGNYTGTNTNKLKDFVQKNAGGGAKTLVALPHKKPKKHIKHLKGIHELKDLDNFLYIGPELKREELEPLKTTVNNYLDMETTETDSFFEEEQCLGSSFGDLSDITGILDITEDSDDDDDDELGPEVIQAVAKAVAKELAKKNHQKEKSIPKEPPKVEPVRVPLMKDEPKPPVVLDEEGPGVRKVELKKKKKKTKKEARGPTIIEAVGFYCLAALLYSIN